MTATQLPPITPPGGPAARVVGIDPSLTATAICCVEYDGSVHLDVHRTKPKTGASTERLTRMRSQVTAVALDAADADLVLIEGPSFSSKGAATRDLAGLWWLMYAELIAVCPNPVGIATPSVLKKWATGSGAADKFRVGQHIGKRWPDVDLRSDDQADALVLASIGLHQAGLLPWKPTAFQIEALTKVEWSREPTVVAA